MVPSHPRSTPGLRLHEYARHVSKASSVASYTRSKVGVRVIFDTVQHDTWLRTTVFTTTKKCERMPFDDKVRLIPNRRKLISGETDIDIDDAMALRAGEVVVVIASSADTIVMSTIRKINPCEQYHIQQLIDRKIDRVSTYKWYVM